jgi:hypothetical protein
MTKGAGEDGAMIDLKSMAVAMPEVAGHPNRVGFQGVLTMVDVASQRSPSGAKGHLVMLTKRAAEAALPSLLGMALDYSPTLDRHDVRRKVGIVTRAEVVGLCLELGGYLYARDFPEIVEEIAKGRKSRNQKSDMRRDARIQVRSMNAVAEWGRRGWDEGSVLRSSLRSAAGRILSFTASNRNSPEQKERVPRVSDTAIHAETCVDAGAAGLGLSYEVTDVQIADTRQDVWALTKVTFTGAAILRRDKAAYRDTWIELTESLGTGL